jgi:hypothetical protein
MNTDNLTKNVQLELLALPDTKPLLAVRACSGRKWKAVKNSSWGGNHVKDFGNRAGYVVCHNNRHGELVALCSVIGQLFVNQTEIDANARLIELAPEMAEMIEKFSILNEEHYKDIAGFILSARELSDRFVLKLDR